MPHICTYSAAVPLSTMFSIGCGVGPTYSPFLLSVFWYTCLMEGLAASLRRGVRMVPEHKRKLHDCHSYYAM